MSEIQIKLKDLYFEYFKRSNSKGGQKQNKTSSAVRLTHIPTGITIESSDGRSQSQNKEKAIEKLKDKLKSLSEELMSKKQQQTYNNKDEASFSSQIRTYRLCGNNQVVVDHRTGITHPNPKEVLNGDIERFLKHGK